MGWLGGVRSDHDVEQALADDLRHWGEFGFGRWILYAESGAVGQVKLEHWQSPAQVDEIEIGYGLVPSAWGHGLATEAGFGALALAARLQLAPSIVAFAHIDNHRSFRVMERLGFHYESDLEVAGHSRLYRRSLEAKIS